MLEKIKALCKERNLSLRGLEDAAKIARNTICRWDENIPSVDKVRRVADVLGVPMDELVESEPTQE